MNFNFKSWKKDKVINKSRLIYMPLFISIFSLAVMSLISCTVSKNMVISQVKSNGVKLTDQAVKHIKGNRASLVLINKLLEEKIELVSKSVLDEKDTLSTDRLYELMAEFEVDELHWIDKDGNTIYTTYEGYRNWTVPEGHPLDVFAESDSVFMVEKVRPNAEFDILTKYGAMKDEDGNLVQVGIRDSNIDYMTRDFNYQTTIKSLEDEENILYAYIVDEKYNTLAGTEVDSAEAAEKELYSQLEDGFKGKVVLSDIYDRKSEKRVLEIVYPIDIDESISELVVVGFSMDKAYAQIEKTMMYSMLITMAMSLVVLWAQKRNIIVPITNLHNNIHNIDLEKNLNYRIPVIKNDNFKGIVYSINSILDNISEYFKLLEKNEKELKSSRELISSAYQKLSISESELRQKYDEIQSYTDEIENLKKKYEIAIQGTNSAVWEIDMEKQTIYFSKEFINITGSSINQLEDLESCIESIFGMEGKMKFIKEYDSYTTGEKEEIYVQLDYKTRDLDKKLLLHGKGIYKSGELKAINGIVMDITKLKEQEEYIEYLAYHDFLTGLPNRRSFLKELKYDIQIGNRGTVILIDLDNFKEINDTMGHIYGDKILRKISEKLGELKLENGFISRFGGDEFLIMLSGETRRKTISEYADRIIELFQTEIVVYEESIFTSCSMGITVYPDDSDDVEKLIMNADMAMYKVKNSGKNSYSFFNEQMTSEMKEKVAIEKQMREALINDGFKLLYQPQVETETGKVSGFEALVRMKSSPISPQVFIAIAEESDIIISLGRYVTEKAIKQIWSWEKSGLRGKTVAVNFSAKQLNDSGYIDFLKEKLKEYDVSPRDLEIEITESVFLEKKEEPLNFLYRLKKMGIKIALDDFGTGYSSFSYLTFLPVSKIKLDKSLCDRFLELKSIKVMDSLISLAHSLNLEVIAEGVESKEQYEKLKVGKCNKIQGYLFSRPLESLEAEKIYNKNFLD